MMNTDPETRALISAMLHRALAAHQAGNLNEAEQFYNRVLACDGKHFDALHMLAVLHGQRGNLDAADRFFQNAAEIKPDYAPCHYNHGNVLFALKQFEKAIACYDRALAIVPGYVEAHFNRGNALLKSGRSSDALASFDQALRLNPNIAEIHSGRGNALRALKRFDEAVACFDQALRLQPNHVEFHANRGNALHELGRLDEALTSFDKAVKANPDDAEVHYNRGNVLYEIGGLENALASFDKAIAINPNDAEFYQNRGNVLLDLGRLEQAFADYDKAWTINPRLHYLEGARLYAKMQLCDWAGLAAEELSSWPISETGLRHRCPSQFLRCLRRRPISSAVRRFTPRISIRPSRVRTKHQAQILGALRTIEFEFAICRPTCRIMRLRSWQPAYSSTTTVHALKRLQYLLG